MDLRDDITENSGLGARRQGEPNLHTTGVNLMASQPNAPPALQYKCPKCSKTYQKIANFSKHQKTCTLETTDPTPADGAIKNSILRQAQVITRGKAIPPNTIKY